jgi:peptide-methionine (R)-S-oxide reductase
MEVAMSRIDETLCSDRRHFLQVALAGGSLLALGALAVVPRLRAAANTPTDMPGDVRLEIFGDDGRDLGVREVPRLVLTEAQWRQRLSPAAYYQMRLADTERPFTGKYWNFYGRGIFRCAACATALYDADTKFHSGTGWPSFYRPIARCNILESTDYSFGMTRIAVSCAGCNSHLGHVFNDGPRPTGLRYCMNSPALHFVPLARA